MGDIYTIAAQGVPAKAENYDDIFPIISVSS